MSGRNIRTERQDDGSIWMSLVATPSVKEGLAAAMVSSGRDVTPKEVLVVKWMRLCKRRLSINLNKRLYNLTATLGIASSSSQTLD